MIKTDKTIYFNLYGYYLQSAESTSKTFLEKSIINEIIIRVLIYYSYEKVYLIIDKNIFERKCQIDHKQETLRFCFDGLRSK